LPIKENSRNNEKLMKTPDKIAISAPKLETIFLTQPPQIFSDKNSLIELDTKTLKSTAGAMRSKLEKAAGLLQKTKVEKET
jgi:hypothetical protein